jgi:hypothetical protein
MKKDYPCDDAQIDEVFAHLFACSQLYDEDGIKRLDGKEENGYRPFISREHYLRADPESRRQLSEFALYFDPRTYQSIREWETAENSKSVFSRIDRRAQLIMKSAYRNLRGHD